MTFICTLNDDNELTLEYLATADAPTICSLTNHSYWNLNGHDGSSVMDQELVLNCSHYTPTDPDNESVPTGEVSTTVMLLFFSHFSPFLSPFFHFSPFLSRFSPPFFAYLSATSRQCSREDFYSGDLTPRL